MASDPDFGPAANRDITALHNGLAKMKSSTEMATEIDRRWMRVAIAAARQADASSGVSHDCASFSPMPFRVLASLAVNDARVAAISAASTPAFSALLQASSMRPAWKYRPLIDFLSAANTS